MYAIRNKKSGRFLKGQAVMSWNYQVDADIVLVFPKRKEAEKYFDEYGDDNSHIVPITIQREDV